MAATSRKLSFSQVVARNLPNTDSRGRSDPYVVFFISGQEVAKTPFLRNPTLAVCSWEGAYETEVVTGNRITVDVEVWDSDGRSADDLLGAGSFDLVPDGATGPTPKTTYMAADIRWGKNKGHWQSVLSCAVEVNPPLTQPAQPAPAPAPTPAPAPPELGGGISYADGRLVSESPQWDAVVARMPAWANTDLPKSGPLAAPVVRKELRKMSVAEQERYAAAVLKMRENGPSGPGTSPYFSLAAMHGGFPPYDRTDYPSYCPHGRENFPAWHRPYLLEFERMMRRADIALGGDGQIGLPYWGWEDLEVDGQVAPKVVRDKLLVEFDDDFFLPRYAGYLRSLSSSSRARAQIVLGTTASDSSLRVRMRAQSGGANETTVGQTAFGSLYTDDHKMHASKTYASGLRKPSIESPHDSVHGAIGGVMGGFRSSFSPLFWLHHNNVDRFYEAYLSYEADSAEQFKRHQRSLTANGRTRGAPGFPDGPWGDYYPFVHPATGRRFHARDAFDTRALGYAFDDLPRKQKQAMREPPYYAVFEGINVLKMEVPRVVWVYVADKTKGGAPPPAGVTAATVTEQPGYAGCASIFFFALERGACENCFVRDAFDIYVDVTQALRANGIAPKHAVLHALVEDDNGDVRPVGETPVPAPAFRGPRFRSRNAGSAADDPDDVAALQAQLVRLGLTEAGAVDGDLGEKTLGALRKFQRAAGLKEDGVPGPKTKARLSQTGLLTDAPAGGAGLDLRLETVRWWLDADTLPAGLAEAGVVAELKMAFAAWAAPAGCRFVCCADAAQAQVKIRWADNSARSADAFDGPGGKLAEADARGIAFDAAERWELQGAPHKQREFVPWEDEYFQLLPVALHEIGHVLGLGHSDDVNDVMAPYYFADRIRLTDNDTRAMEALREARLQPKTQTPAEASAYVQEHQLENVLGDMLNAVLPTSTTRPLTAMSNYLADLAAEKGE